MGPGRRKRLSSRQIKSTKTISVQEEHGSWEEDEEQEEQEERWWTRTTAESCGNSSGEQGPRKTDLVRGLVLLNGSAAHLLVWEVFLSGSAAYGLQRRSRLRRWGLRRTNHATAGQHQKQCRQQQQQQEDTGGRTEARPGELAEPPRTRTGGRGGGTGGGRGD